MLHFVIFRSPPIAGVADFKDKLEIDCEISALLLVRGVLPSADSSSSSVHEG